MNDPKRDQISYPGVGERRYRECHPIKDFRMDEALLYKHEAPASEFCGCLMSHSLALCACIRFRNYLAVLPQSSVLNTHSEQFSGGEQKLSDHGFGLLVWNFPDERIDLIPFDFHSEV